MLERNRQRQRRFVLALLWSVSGLANVSSTSTRAVAEEPVKPFLEKLKQDRLYDVALRYLDIEEKKGRLPEAIKVDLPLERILLMQASLSLPQNASELEAKLDGIEKTIRDFLSSSAGHPRIAEAQLKLGDVLRDRAAAAINQAKPSNQAPGASSGSVNELREKARKYLAEADQIYAKIIADLTPTLQNLAGNRARTAEEIALRDNYQEFYRQAEMLQAKTFEFIAETHDVGSASWRENLTKAEAKLTDIIGKATSRKEAGRRVLCQLYRGIIQTKLDKKREARESLVRVAEIQEGGPFALWRNEAVTNLIRLDLAETPPKFEAAIIRGDEALKPLNNNELNEPTAIELQLEVAKAKIEFAKTLTASKDNNRQRAHQREARSLLQNLLRINGPHRDAALKALTELGGSQSLIAKAEELPEAKNFEEALGQARTRIERAETAEQTVPLLTQQAVATEEIEKVKAEIQKDREQAIAILLRAISLYQEADGREKLLDAKYYLAYSYLRTDQYWEAYAVASAIVESDKNTETGSKAAGFALVAISKIIDATGKNEQAFLIPSLERLAKLLIEIAPGTDGARNAVDILVTLSVREKRYEDAERYIQLAEGNSSSGASFLGQMLWRDFLHRQAEHKKNGTVESDEDKSLQQKAQSLLETAWQNQAAGRNDSVALYGTTTLASIYLAADRVDDALRLINEPGKGALAIIGSNDSFEAKERLEVYRLQLLALIQQSAAPNAQPLDAKQVETSVAKMKELAGADDSLLTNALRNLAASVNSKVMETNDKQLQARIGNALGILVSQLAQSSNDIAVLDSAASSVYSLAAGLAKVPGLSGQAEELMKIADQVYERIAARSPEELAAANRKPEDVQMRIALAKAGAGKYEDAHRIFTQTLTKLPMNVTFQLAAAKNLQDWAAEKDTALLQKAWAGAEPTSAGGNAIWGWNKIAQLTAARVKEPTFRDVYFDARYNLAKCRMLIGLASQDSATKKSELNQAIRIILQTRGIHPDFGTPEFKAKFDLLEQQVRAELGNG